jgi:ABC-2 type transport system permease protein
MKTRILAILRKEMAEIWRDPYTLGMALVLPLVLLFLFAYALNLDVKNISLIVFDQDQSADSRAYVRAFVNSGYFSVVGTARSQDDIQRALDTGTAKVALVIPPSFGRDLSAGRRADVQAILDGSFPPSAQVAEDYVNAINDAFSAERVSVYIASRTGYALLPAVKAQPRVWFNPTLESINAMVPGLFAVILLAFPPLLSALAIVREKERGSVQQIFVSPTQPYEFILGKLIPYGGLAFVEMLTILLAGVFWFRVPFQGSVLLLLLAGLIYVFASVGIGLLVSTVTRTQVAAVLMALVLTMMPSTLFSGFIYPLHTMPLVQQLLSAVFPARYFTDIARGIVMKGSDLGVLWNDFAILLAYTAAVIGLAAWRFHKKVA